MKSKIILVVAIVCLICVNKSYSQFISGVGLKAGATFSNDNFNYFSMNNFDTKYHIGYNGSIYADFLKNKNFNIQTEIGYDQRGYKVFIIRTDEFGTVIGTYTDSYDTHYLTTGISAKFKYPGKNFTPYLIAGPRMDIYLGYTSHTQVDVIGAGSLINPVLEDFKKINYSISIGGGIEFNRLLPFKTFIEINYLPQINTSYDGQFLKVKEYSFNVKLGINFIKEKKKYKK